MEAASAQASRYDGMTYRPLTVHVLWNLLLPEHILQLLTHMESHLEFPIHSVVLLKEFTAPHFNLFA